MKTTEILDNLTTDQLLNILPENMPLYKDSGLWNIYDDQFKTELFHQGVNESLNSFLKRSILELEKSEYSDSLHFDIIPLIGNNKLNFKKLSRFFELENRKLREQVENLTIPVVSHRTFTPNCTEIEDMAEQIDQFINQHALAKPGTYSRKLREFLATKLDEYGV